MMFIDGNNLFYTSQIINIDIDYIKLVHELVRKDQLLRVNFYAGVDDSASSAGWLYFMRKSGIRMVTKPLQILPDGSKKANCDVEMAVDLVGMASTYDTAIVLTGDGDFTYALETVAKQGKQVELVGSKLNTNESLIQAADRFVDLEGLKGLIQK